MLNETYIIPNFSIHDDITPKKDSGYLRFLDDESSTLSDIFPQDRLYIQGDPGYGKSKLLKEIIIEGEKKNYKGIYIDLKKIKSQPIETFINETSLKNKLTYSDYLDKPIRGYFSTDDFFLENNSNVIICLDAIDEVSDEILKDTLLDSIYNFVEKFNKSKIYISGRTHNFNKLKTILPKPRKYLTLEKFEDYQVRDFLKNYKPNITISDETLENILKSVSALKEKAYDFPTSIIQIPRYLTLFVELLTNENSDKLKENSKFDLFDLFVNEKLNKEKNELKLDTELVKKLLANIALVMQIKQTTTISKEELIVILDDIKSDIKNIAFNNQESLENIYKHTLLKDDDFNIEFENKEFQEFLAAREILNLGNPEQLLYDLAFVPELKEFKVFWYNTIGFLINQNTKLILMLIDYMSSNKLLSETFFALILENVNSNSINNFSIEEKNFIFKSIYNYHQENNYYLSSFNSENLLLFYTDTTLNVYEDLKSLSKDKNEIQITNLLRIFPEIVSRSESIQANEEEIVKLLNRLCNLKDFSENVAYYAISAIAAFNKVEYLKIYETLLKSGNKTILDVIFRKFENYANEPFVAKQILFFLTEFRIYSISPFYVFEKITEKKILLQLLAGIRNSLGACSSFILNCPKHSIQKIIENIKNTDEIEIKESLTKIILDFLKSDFNHYMRFGSLDNVISILTFIKDHKPDFIFEIFNSVKQKQTLHSITRIFPPLLTKDNAIAFIELFKSEKDNNYIINSIRFDCKDTNPEVYNILTAHFQIIETTTNSSEIFQKESVLNEFLRMLEPEPPSKNYNLNLFTYLNSEFNTIYPLLTSYQKNEIADLIVNVIRDARIPDVEISINEKNDNSVNATITATNLFHFIRPIVELLGKNNFNIEINKYRKELLAYIPFCFNSDYEKIVSLFNPLDAGEIQYLVDRFLNRKDDLLEYGVSNFADVAKKFKIKNALPKLKEFFEKKEFRKFEKENILEAIGELEDNIGYFIELNETFNSDDSLKEAINEILIRKFDDKNAIKWRIDKLKTKSFKHIDKIYDDNPNHMAHYLSDKEIELTGFSFAKPILELDSIQYKELFYDLLDFSFHILDEDVLYEDYAKYLWKIIIGYFDNLKKDKQYSYLYELEKKLDNYKNLKGINQFTVELKTLRKSYADFIESSKGLTHSIKIYNSIKERKYLDVYSEDTLFYLLENVIYKDLRKWIEADGAYKFIEKYRPNKSVKKFEREDLIQKTIKTQIENLLLKKGLRDFELSREPQKLNDERADFCISYGFIGPILMELKLSTNGDITDKTYKEKLLGYLDGFHAKKGLYIIFRTDRKQSLLKFNKIILGHQELYKDTAIKVVGMNCLAEEKDKKTSKQRQKKISLKKIEVKILKEN